MNMEEETYKEDGSSKGRKLGTGGRLWTRLGANYAASLWKVLSVLYIKLGTPVRHRPLFLLAQHYMDVGCWNSWQKEQLMCNMK